MTRKRTTYTPSFKARVALAALQGDKTANELASQFGIHPTLLRDWKKLLLQGAESLFAHGPSRPDAAAVAAEAQQAELYEQIGRLKMELEWLKKKVGLLG
jgi:putative transposase